MNATTRRPRIRSTSSLNDFRMICWNVCRVCLTVSKCPVSIIVRSTVV